MKVFQKPVFNCISIKTLEPPRSIVCLWWTDDAYFPLLYFFVYKPLSTAIFFYCIEKGFDSSEDTHSKLLGLILEFCNTSEIFRKSNWNVIFVHFHIFIYHHHKQFVVRMHRYLRSVMFVEEKHSTYVETTYQ